jgi:hypothetical protein
VQQPTAYRLELLVDDEADVVVVAAVLTEPFAVGGARSLPAVPFEVLLGETEDFTLA